MRWQRITAYIKDAKASFFMVSKNEEYRRMIMDLLALEFEKNKSYKEYIFLSEKERGCANLVRDHYSWNVLFNPIAVWAGLNRIAI